jgi:hypothetical protein
LLTPRGIEEKARLTVRFLQIKMREYESLRDEIEQLRREVGHAPPAVGEQARGPTRSVP